MRRRTLAEIAAVTGGSVVPADAGDVAADGVLIDSRQASTGQVFVALPGDRTDGHDFVEAALAAGASAALVRAVWEPPVEGTHGPLIRVEDPQRALMDLAADERRGLAATVIGITGSTGKTCTKDFIAAILGKRFRVVASERSFNNEVGLPLTILRTDPSIEVLVCEMGGRGPGHIKLLCDIARPSVGVVTNVGVAHMELFGSPEALRAAKAELPEALPADGMAVLNADDPVVGGYADRTAARTVWYGTSPKASVRADRIALDPENACATFVLTTPDGGAKVTLPVPGEHMVPNALAAAAVGMTLGMVPAEIAEGLAAARMSTGRMEMFRTADGLRVVNDAYNANPTSMAAALKSARWMGGKGRVVAVLGHMAELGDIAAQEHERIGELLVRLGIDVLITVGDQAEEIAVGAEREGVEPERIVRAEDVAHAVAAVRRIAAPGDLVLVKASRVARLERVAEALRGGAAPANEAGA